MPENLRIALDILALLAIIVAVVRGIFTASGNFTQLTSQVATHTSWIEGHEEWSEKQTSEIKQIREDIAYIRGKLEHEERMRTT